MPLDIYYTPREAAEYLRTSVSTLAKRRLYDVRVRWSSVYAYPASLRQGYVTGKPVKAAANE